MNQKEIEMLAMLIGKAKKTLVVGSQQPEFIVTKKTSHGWEVEGTTPWIHNGSVDHFRRPNGDSPTCETVSIC